MIELETTKINIARYRLRFRVLEGLQLHGYAGSALRGVFGRALLQLSGLTYEDVQEKTTLYQYSPYAAVFEPMPSQGVGLLSKLDGIPVPYIIEAPASEKQLYQKDEIFEFDLVLFGAALEHLSIIILAWRRALLRGIGKNESNRAELVEVLHCNSGQWDTIYSETLPIIATHSTELDIPIFEQPQTLHLKFNTHLRLKHSGLYAGKDELSQPLLIRNIVRRVTFFLQLQQPQQLSIVDVERLNKLADQVTGRKELHYVQWKRHSSRQKKTMELSGYAGRWLLHEVPAELLPYIWIGQYLHVGKNTSFGLGGYEISDEPWLEAEAGTGCCEE